MKRFLTTLIILLVVIVAGLTTLVMLVNPNDFRHYIVEQVDKKSGYQLEFNGDMRWHVWPTLSIITGPISLTAPNATTPVLSAENMRLDVELWPLISHKLSVEQIVIDGAVIRKTPESEPKIHTNAPVAPGGTAPSSSPTEKTNWLLDIEKINISNSLVIWQTAKDEFNLRNINLSLKKSDKKQIAAKFSGNLNKNQQELIF
nr:AsmA family protein [Providencia rettgeri]